MTPYGVRVILKDGSYDLLPHASFVVADDQLEIRTSEKRRTKYLVGVYAAGSWSSVYLCNEDGLRIDIKEYNP